MREFNEILRELRVSKKESQKDLANYLKISFQSVSKWEQGIHYPDLPTIKEIAKHYNVSINYLLSMDNETVEHKELMVDVSVNVVGKITVWTDFDYMGTIAPESESDKLRHAPGNRFLPTHPGPKETIVIGVNEKNEICFLGDHIDNQRPSCGPHGLAYTKSSEEGSHNPCLIILDGYDKSYNNCKKFEFVIPKKGFVIVLPRKTILTKEIITFLLPQRARTIVDSIYPILGNNDWHAFRDVLLSDELNNCHIYLTDNKIEITKEEKENNTSPSDSEIEKNFEVLSFKIGMLEKELKTMKNRIDDLESAIDDLEFEIE